MKGASRLYFISRSSNAIFSLNCLCRSVLGDTRREGGYTTRPGEISARNCARDYSFRAAKILISATPGDKRKITSRVSLYCASALLHDAAKRSVDESAGIFFAEKIDLAFKAEFEQSRCHRHVVSGGCFFLDVSRKLALDCGDGSVFMMAPPGFLHLVFLARSAGKVKGRIIPILETVEKFSLNPRRVREAEGAQLARVRFIS
jgi:hypothetical protein